MIAVLPGKDNLSDAGASVIVGVFWYARFKYWQRMQNFNYFPVALIHSKTIIMGSSVYVIFIWKTEAGLKTLNVHFDVFEAHPSDVWCNTGVELECFFYSNLASPVV